MISRIIISSVARFRTCLNEIMYFAEHNSRPLSSSSSDLEDHLSENGSYISVIQFLITDQTFLTKRKVMEEVNNS